MMDETCIASWIVIDGREDATAFPSVGGSSASQAFQLVYWKCLVVFFLTSRSHNPHHRHILYSNVDVTVAAPEHIVRQLRQLGVEFRQLPITYRLPTGSVSRWGNQFYVLDIIRHFASEGPGSILVLTDSDCVFRKPVSCFESAIHAHGCLLYTLRPQDQKNYEDGQLLNGMSHARMSEVAIGTLGAPPETRVHYHGGEFFAASRDYCRMITAEFDRLWQVAVAEAGLPDSIKEEAHFLSIIADAHAVPPYSGNHIIRRMWTNFEDLNLEPQDLDLVIWHLPAEKKYGFRRLWKRVAPEQDLTRFSGQEINRLTSEYMGVPRRDFRKFLLDVLDKLRERTVGRLVAAR